MDFDTDDDWLSDDAPDADDSSHDDDAADALPDDSGDAAHAHAGAPFAADHETPDAHDWHAPVAGDAFDAVEGEVPDGGGLGGAAPAPGEPDVWPNYDPASHTPVIGDAARDVQHWHLQETSTTCAVASQEFALESITGQQFEEGALAREAAEHGWYTANGGTPSYATGNLLAAHGVPVVHEYGVTLEQLGAKLAAHQKVIVSVDPDEIWHPDQTDQDDALARSMGVPSRGATHAVQVIGIVPDPSDPRVILNDPGHPDGRGMMVPAARFLDAWADSGNLAVSTVAHTAAAAPAPPPQYLQPHQPMQYGYYNADGSYHLMNDNTDRDPWTWAVVRRY